MPVSESQSPSPGPDRPGADDHGDARGGTEAPVDRNDNPDGTPVPDAGTVPSRDAPNPVNDTPLAGSDAGSPPTVPSPTLQSDTGKLVIPMLPQTEAELNPILGEDGKVISDQVITFGWGPDYPTRVRITLGKLTALLNSETTTLPIAPMVLDTVRSLSPEVITTFVDEQSFDVEVSDLGSFPIQLEGHAPPEEQFVLESWTLDITVRVRQVAGANWVACGATTPTVISGTPLKSSLLTTFDESGEQLYLHNAAPGRPLTLTVEAEAGTQLSTTDGLAQLVVSGPPQFVSVTAASGAVGDLRLVGVDAVDGLDMDYFLCASWTRGMSLMSGMSLGDSPSKDSPGHIDITAHPTVGGTRACSVLPAGSYDITAGDTATCRTTEGSSCSGSNALAIGVDVDGPGTCEVNVRVPEANAGSGVVDVLSVNVEEPAR